MATRRRAARLLQLLRLLLLVMLQGRPHTAERAAAMRHSELTAALVLTLVLLLLPLWVRTPSCCCRIYLVYFK